MLAADNNIFSFVRKFKFCLSGTTWETEIKTAHYHTFHVRFGFHFFDRVRGLRDWYWFLLLCYPLHFANKSLIIDLSKNWVNMPDHRSRDDRPKPQRDNRRIGSASDRRSQGGQNQFQNKDSKKESRWGNNPHGNGDVGGGPKGDFGKSQDRYFCFYVIVS